MKCKHQADAKFNTMLSVGERYRITELPVLLHMSRFWSELRNIKGGRLTGRHVLHKYFIIFIFSWERKLNTKRAIDVNVNEIGCGHKGSSTSAFVIWIPNDKDDNWSLGPFVSKTHSSKWDAFVQAFLLNISTWVLL